MPGSLVKGTSRFKKKQTDKETNLDVVIKHLDGKKLEDKVSMKERSLTPTTPVSITMFVVVSFTVHFSQTFNTDRKTDGQREGDRYRWYVWYHTNIKPGLTFNISKTLSTVSKDQDKSIHGKKYL
jgi:hypothetical protein